MGKRRTFISPGIDLSIFHVGLCSYPFLEFGEARGIFSDCLDCAVEP